MPARRLIQLGRLGGPFLERPGNEPPTLFLQAIQSSFVGGNPAHPTILDSQGSDSPSKGVKKMEVTITPPLTFCFQDRVKSPADSPGIPDPFNQGAHHLYAFLPPRDHGFKFPSPHTRNRQVNINLSVFSDLPS